MESLVGRQVEKELLTKALNSGQAELIAIYGRRRIGKTFLVKQVYKQYIKFELTGLNSASKRDQLENFIIALSKKFKTKINLNIPQSWLQAFELLKSYFEEIEDSKPKVIFLDEIPWLDSHKSSFLNAFGSLWNSWAINRPDIKIVICGSSASWMINKVITNRGGLYNRITRRIKLKPFSLYETEIFLRHNRISLDRYSILQLYMVMGGIPHYLKDVERGLSATQNIAKICFSEQGLLRDEYENLFPALFDYAERHYEVINSLSKQKIGLTRNQILETTKLSSGGTTSKVIRELVESDFVSQVIPFDRKEKDSIFRLSDEYILFYLKFMQRKRVGLDENYWIQKMNTTSWRSWAGYAFEAICFKHLAQIKQALGISGIYSESSSWRVRGTHQAKGVQIDLLIDRKDQVINLIEIKYSIDQFTISKKYNEELREKLSVFREFTKTRKTLLLTFLTTYGLTQNQYAVSNVQQDLTMDILFSK